MKSMTGYGLDETRDSASGVAFRVEATSVNGKSLEVRPILPRELAAYDIPMRRLVESVIQRGTVTIRVDVELSAAQLNSTLKINESLVTNIIRKCAKIESKLEIQRGVSLADVLQLPGVVESKPPDFNVEDARTALDGCASNALAMLDQSRLDEGERLARDMRERLDGMATLVTEITPLVEALPETQKQRLIQKLEDSRLNVDPTDESVLKEIVLLADKCDVSEELERLRAHFQQFKAVMDRENEPIGRNLEFITQEMLREIGTLGVKAAHVDVSPKVVKFKTELEKIREQVRNIE